jgi:hypothetical protein
MVSVLVSALREIADGPCERNRRGRHNKRMCHCKTENRYYVSNWAPERGGIQVPKIIKTLRFGRRDRLISAYLDKFSR